MRTFWATLLALTLLFGASPASAYGVARDYRHNQVASNVSPGAGHGSGWQGFSPTWLTGLVFWARSDLGVTTVTGPVVATGTTPPTVTLAGTPTAAQTSAATPYVELDCTTLGALGTSKYTVKVNGATTATNVASAASGVVLTGSGITAGWAVGASAVNDVYKANLTVSQWNDISGRANNTTQATALDQPISIAANGVNGRPKVSEVGSGAMGLQSTTAPAMTQPFQVSFVGLFTSSAPGGNQYALDFGAGNRNVTLQESGAAAMQQYNGTLANAKTTTANVVHFVESQFNNGTTSGVAIDGSALTTGSNPGTTASAGGLEIGNFYGSGASSWGGDLYEFAVTTGSLDPSTRARLHAYSQNLYGSP